MESYTHPVGPNTLQKVMAGDVVSANVQYYYNAQPSSNANILPAVLGSLLQALGGSATTSVVHQSATNITSQLSNSIPFQTAVQPSNPNGSQTPQAYLTLLFFDERFNLIDAQDGGVVQQQVASSVTSNGANLPLLNIRAPKNGYVYAYVSNQSNTDVYFDNLAVSIAQGHILEENHYYAFGLKIQGISSKRNPDAYEGKSGNNFLYNGKELLDEDGDLGWLDYGFRSYDPQIGRFPQLDPLTNEYPFLTPYQYASNDPITNIDIDGLEGTSIVGGLSEAAKTASARVMDLFVITAAVKATGKMSNGHKLYKVIKTGFYVVRAVQISSQLFNAGPARAAGESTCQGCGNAAIARRNNQQFQFQRENPTYDPDVLMKDVNGTGVAGPQSQVMQTVQGRQAEYNQALGDAISGGIFGSFGYLTGGDKWAFALQYIDQAAQAHFALEPTQIGEPILNEIPRRETTFEGVRTSRGFRSFSAFKREMGPAGQGQAWHHIVEQTPSNIIKFGNEAIHNTNNLIRLPHGSGSIHAKVSGYYSSIQPFTGGKTVRQWLSTQSFQEQYNFGIEALKKFGWKP